MKCSIDGCPGEYEAGKVMHTVRHHGQVMVIDHVPADICSVCGDVLLRPDTVRKIEALLQDKHQSVSTVPLYEFAYKDTGPRISKTSRNERADRWSH